MRRGRPRHDDVLTPREWQVLDLLREGLTNNQIADRLGISHDTAKFHVSEILTKLGVESREEAAAWSGRPKVHFRLSLPFGIGSVPPLKLAGFGAIAASVVALVALAIGVLLDDENTSLGKIAFVREGNIWVQQLPNGTPFQLTDNEDGALAPRWSPDGEWLLYTRVHLGGDSPFSSWVIRKDGTRERHLSPEGFFAGWLPEYDHRLVHETTDHSIVTAEADGTAMETIFEPFIEAGEEVRRYGFWPLPGTQTAIVIEVRYPVGELDEESPEPSYFAIAVQDPSNGEVRPVISNHPTEDGQLAFIGLSHDESHLLFIGVPSEDTESGAEDALRLTSAPIDGGPPKYLFPVSPFHLEWSRSNASVILIAGGSDEGWTDKSIALLAPDASDYTLLTPSGMTTIDPVWSPDATQIAFVANPDLGMDGRDEALLSRRIWVMNSDGSNQRQITSGAAFRDEAPLWSSDGETIIFARLRPGVFCDSERYELVEHTFTDSSERILTRNLALASGLRPTGPGTASLCDNTDTPFQQDLLGDVDVSQYLDWWQPGDN